MSPTVQVIEIPESKLSTAKSIIEKLTRKANKLGLTPPKIRIGLQYKREVTISTIQSGFQTDRKVYKTFFPVTITFEPLKVGNYTFIGKIDHANGNIIKSVPGKEIPQQYYNSDCFCDHCNVQRYRTETFIFKNENAENEYKKVGRSCLKDFFGIDPSKEIELYDSLIQIESDRDIHESEGWINPYNCEFDVTETIALGIALSKKFGYVSRKVAEMYEKISTSSLIFEVYFPTKDSESIEFSNTYYSKIQENISAAQEMIEWGKNQFANGKTEYAHNMLKFLNSDSITVKYFGYLISLIGVFNKEKSERKEKVISEYVGTVGQKEIFEVTCNRVIVTDGYYGRSYIYIMTDKKGNKITWISSNDLMEEGNSYTVKATIKEHKLYNNEKQTVITRGKVM